MNKLRQELANYFFELQINNTHCHHLADDFFEDISLKKNVSMTYSSWICPPFDDTDAGWESYFERMGVNSYGYRLAEAFGCLYGDGTPMTIDNYRKIDAKLKTEYAQNSQKHLQILTEKCKFQNIVLDDYKRPGSNHGLRVMRPAFRTDMFLHGHTKGETDENENNPYDHFDIEPQTLQQYVAQMEQAVQNNIQKNKISALKLAIAYERDLNFDCFDEDAASRAFGKSTITPAEKTVFENYIVDCLCKIAAKYSIPFQIHTGLGQLAGTRAIHLLPLIKRHPNTKFVLFHCSYPWMEDVLALGHNFSNVYPDICWLPLLSTTAAHRFVSEALDVLDIYRLCWGCDCWTAEESYGAKLAVVDVLSRVLAEKVAQGYYSLAYAKKAGKYILYDNAKKLYGF